MSEHPRCRAGRIMPVVALPPPRRSIRKRALAAARRIIGRKVGAEVVRSAIRSGMDPVAAQSPWPENARSPSQSVPPIPAYWDSSSPHHVGDLWRHRKQGGLQLAEPHEVCPRRPSGRRCHPNGRHRGVPRSRDRDLSCDYCRAGPSLRALRVRLAASAMATPSPRASPATKVSHRGAERE